MAETEDGRAALQTLAEDDQVMLSLLVDTVGETRGQAFGAAAVEVTKVLRWVGLAGWLGEDTLARRVGELRSVAENGREITEDERGAVYLAAEYADGNRPRTPWERPARTHPQMMTVGAPTTDAESADVIDTVHRNPRHTGEGAAPDGA
jgi:hypothetical protein